MATTRVVFSRHNLRCTCQRLALYEALAEEKSHPTAEELFRRVKPRTERLSLATVYNTLEALCKAGLARKLPTSNGICRYEAGTGKHVHVCFLEDDEIQDVPKELGDNLIEHLPRSVIAEIEQALGIRVDGVRIQLMARRSCSASRNSVPDVAGACIGSTVSAGRLGQD